MNKRFQVFISSTFRDLQDERQAVLRAILELDHIPAGMELFPAADETAWDLIKDVIESSDYYALIIGGRYGSLDEAGIGYTEKEYDYAISLKKPVIPLLHRELDCTFAAARQKEPYMSYKGTFYLSWNDIFAAVAPSTINESRQWNLKWSLQKFFEKRAKEQFMKNARLTDASLKDFKFEDDVFDTCIVQFRALGLIKENKKARSVKDTDTYWTLTPYGDYLMVNLRALRRERPEERDVPTEFSEDIDDATLEN